MFLTPHPQNEHDQHCPQRCQCDIMWWTCMHVCIVLAQANLPGCEWVGPHKGAIPVILPPTSNWSWGAPENAEQNKHCICKLNCRVCTPSLSNPAPVSTPVRGRGMQHCQGHCMLAPRLVSEQGRPCSDMSMRRWSWSCNSVPREPGPVVRCMHPHRQTCQQNFDKPCTKVEGKPCEKQHVISNVPRNPVVQHSMAGMWNSFSIARPIRKETSSHCNPFSLFVIYVLVCRIPCVL